MRESRSGESCSTRRSVCSGLEIHGLGIRVSQDAISRCSCKYDVRRAIEKDIGTTCTCQKLNGKSYGPLTRGHCPDHKFTITRQNVFSIRRSISVRSSGSSRALALVEQLQLAMARLQIRRPRQGRCLEHCNFRLLIQAAQRNPSR